MQGEQFQQTCPSKIPGKDHATSSKGKHYQLTSKVWLDQENKQPYQLISKERLEQESNDQEIQPSPNEHGAINSKFCYGKLTVYTTLKAEACQLISKEWLEQESNDQEIQASPRSLILFKSITLAFVRSGRATLGQNASNFSPEFAAAAYMEHRILASYVKNIRLTCNFMAKFICWPVSKEKVQELCWDCVMET
uniref:Uncharacterized protein n=1 Tax=Glossina pallidipes TaxID=7398 RepID=A0A1B0A9J1_GLOPL